MQSLFSIYLAGMQAATLCSGYAELLLIAIAHFLMFFHDMQYNLCEKG